jgi:NAD(P)-dependent dehydrogenase (short-subunit alcohol dehydrogenase family)
MTGMNGKLTGKVVLVTGGGGGKGLALAKALIRQGAHVVITDINDDGGTANAVAVGQGGEYLHLDVTDEANWIEVVATILRRHGKLDVLVNSARIHTRNNDLATTSLESWRAQLAVNLDGAFLGIKHCLYPMRSGSGGAIVNVVSVSAIAPFAPAPPYSASHAALLNLTRTTAVNCARGGDNIRANAVICGMSSNSPVSEIMDVAKRMIPLGRPAYAEDIADAIVWLACDDSRYVTGTSVVLDGGYTAESYAGT